MFNKVVKFNQDILGIEPRPLGLQTQDEYELSYLQIKEEADEFLQACEEGDFVGVIDAIIDNIVFSLGILYKLGLNEFLYTSIFNTIMNANMEKRSGIKAGREGFDSVDAIKPKGWVSPERRIEEILNEFNNS